MFAAVYHEFGGPIRIETVPLPTCPDDGVVVQVLATGVCRSDWHGWKGHDSDIRAHGLPFCPGHEVSGTIVHIGQHVRRFRAGDRVAVPFILSCGCCHYCNSNRSTVCLHQKQPGFTQFGSFAEYLALPRADRNLAIIPDGVSYQQAAALGCRFTTAYRAVLQQGNLHATDSVAIFGCGGLGLSCIMLAVARGCTMIIAVDVSEAALQKALDLGATHTVNARKQDVRQTVQDITQGGADVSVEASGFKDACQNAVWCTRRAGRMVQVGLVTDPVRIPMDLVAAREIEIVGSHGFAATDLPDLLELVASGKLDPALLIEREVTLEEGAKAIEAMDTRSPLGITMVTKFPANVASRL
jgi:alcohol dehydrogenase